MTAPPATLADVWLVRHAPTSWTGVRWCGRADPPLTAEGERAAAQLATRLASELPNDVVVVASPAARARATALAIAGRVEAPLVVLDDLVEVDVGRAEGLTWADLEAREPELAAAIAAGEAFDWPGGEARAEVAARAQRAAASLASIAAGRPVVVVSHGAFLRALGAVLDPDSDVPPGNPVLEPCGVQRIDRR
jgi:ribonuclease H / adenosylcobalamin/alpha-ribazole phosphatase